MDHLSNQDKLIEGETLFNRNRMVKAEEVFQSLLCEDSENKEALNNLGVIAYQRGDLEKASRYFRDALKLDPVYQDAIDNLFLVHQARTQGHRCCSSYTAGGHYLTTQTPLNQNSEGVQRNSSSDSIHQLDPHVKLVKDRKAFVVDNCRGKSVLHIGCVGSGAVEERLKDRSHLHYRIGLVAKSLIGLDINREGLASLRRAGYENCLFADVETDGIDPQWIRDVDLIVVPEVLEHLANPGKFLARLKNLAFNGDILISVPNAFSFRTLYYLKRHNIEFVHPDHNYYFSPNTLETLLNKHGFSIIDSAMYYWPSNDSFGQELAGDIEEHPYLAEGIIVVARDNGDHGDAKGAVQAGSHNEKAPFHPNHGVPHGGSSQGNLHAVIPRGSTMQSSDPHVPWKLYSSPGVTHHAENARKMLRLDHYIPSIHYNDPVWFFGMYFNQDYLQVLAHQGRRIVNWRGSDALQLRNSPWRIGIVKQIEALHVCQSERQQAILREKGVDAIIRPMMNADPKGISLRSLPTGHGPGILVYWRRGIDNFIRADMFFAIAAKCPDATFHIVGDEDPGRFNQLGRENIIFHGFLDEKALHRLMDQCKGTIRPWISDGNPNIQTKMLLKGRYAAHNCKFEKVAQCRTADDYVDWIRWLETVTEPNWEAREWWLRNLNNFDFLDLAFDIKKEKETQKSVINRRISL